MYEGNFSKGSSADTVNKMLRPGVRKLSHPGLQHAIGLVAFIAQVYRGGETRRFLHDLEGEAERASATGASTRVQPDSARGLGG